MHKAVIFDLDGTLIDPKEGLINSLDDTLRHYKLPQLSDEIKQSFIGPPIIRSLQKTYSLSDEQANEISNYFRDVYKDVHLLKAVVYDGVYELLDWLKSNGSKLAVATYKRDDYAKTLMEHYRISSYCDFVLGSDFENKLTKADIVDKCVEVLNVKPKDAVLIGDTMGDFVGALQCGTSFIAVTYGYGDFETAALEYASYIAKSPFDLLQYFKRYSG